ncbi:hypothetical protein [Halovivax cerinus]|uniref:Rubrerythrin-like domain-containing protein n=1 Tax=Halovivax cerinus TaxID=1487865 RepID=A0ABD5NJC6_9EURY|nr:hypothetical protein [Halovivax cerinus]
MTESIVGETRPFFACEACGAVYARREEPQLCRLCEATLFVVVYPDRYA